MFLLPWSSGAATEKVLPKAPKIAVAESLAAPMSHVSLFNKQKRKREENAPSGDRANDAKSPEQRKKQFLQSPVMSPAGASASVSYVGESNLKGSEATNQTPISLSKKPEMGSVGLDGRESENASSSGPTTYDIMNLTPLQQTIESQFSLEILLKHRELRLIDQELAKCQVALEQLRRCHVMPYPASSSDPNIMQQVSSGTGPAYQAQAQSPSPWGISEGPYARHYAKWLIPDSAFDDNVASEPSYPMGGNALPERATRGSKSNKAHPTRAQRGSARERLQSLPHGYPEPKEDKGPMIVKRSTDGRMVKLVCLDCRRDNFNSAQGFINHCRIAHSRGFASHDAAAIACGEEIDTDANGEVVGGVTGSSHPSAALVHPLIRSAHLTASTPHVSPATQQRRKKMNNSTWTSNRLLGNVDGANESALTPKSQLFANGDSMERSPFRPSPQTPHLSALFAKCGRGGDLEEMVIEATKKPEPEISSADEDDEDEVEESIEQHVPPQPHGSLGVIRGGARLPARSGMSPAPLERTPSSKGLQKITQRRPDYITNITPSASHNSSYLPEPRSIPISQHHSLNITASPPLTSPTTNLSPNTIESHPAPSLISDDEDNENTHSESETPSSAVVSDDEDHFEVEVTDSEHHPMDLDPRGGSSATGEYGIGKAHHPAPQPARRHPPAIRHPPDRSIGQRRVSFQSPAPRPKAGARRKGGK